MVLPKGHGWLLVLAPWAVQRPGLLLNTGAGAAGAVVATLGCLSSLATVAAGGVLVHAAGTGCSPHVVHTRQSSHMLHRGTVQAAGMDCSRDMQTVTVQKWQGQ